MLDDKTVNDIFEKISYMSGTMTRFIETQDKYNDNLFATQRKHDSAIGSLLQTRRTQWKVIGVLGTFSTALAAFAHKIFPSIPPPP